MTASSPESFKRASRFKAKDGPHPSTLDASKREHLGKAIGATIVAGVFVVSLLITPGLPGFLLATGLALVWVVIEIANDR